MPSQESYEIRSSDRQLLAEIIKRDDCWVCYPTPEYCPYDIFLGSDYCSDSDIEKIKQEFILMIETCNDAIKRVNKLRRLR